MTNANVKIDFSKINFAEEGELAGFVRMIQDDDFDVYINSKGEIKTFVSEDEDDMDHVEAATRNFFKQPVDVLTRPIIEEMRAHRAMFAKDKRLGEESLPEMKTRYYTLLNLLCSFKHKAEHEGQIAHETDFAVRCFLGL